MRIKELILDRFGNFKDKHIAFGKKQPGVSDFHIIYGGNEAGKTTLTEAWLRLLFGIGRQEKHKKYAFDGVLQSLKISAWLESEGKEFFISRVPQGHNSRLQDIKGKVLNTAFLLPYIKNMKEEQYEELLCLNGRDITEGSENLLNTGEETGKLLFAASSGKSAFPALLQQQKNKAEELYKQSGSKNRFAELKRAYDDAAEKVRNLEISTPRYQQLQDALEEAKQTERQCRQVEQQLRHDLKLLQEFIQARNNYHIEDRQFSDTVEKFCDHAEALGIKDSLYTERQVQNLYQRLHGLAVGPVILQELETLRSTWKDAALQRQNAQESVRQAENKCETSSAEGRNLQAAMLSAAARQALADLLHQWPLAEIENLKEAALKAETRKAEAQNRVREAREALAIKGQIFADIPCSRLSAADYRRLLQNLQEEQRQNEILAEKLRILNVELAKNAAELAAKREEI